MHMLDIQSVQNNQYITTYTWTSLNTVGSCPSLYITSCFNLCTYQKQRINLPFISFLFVRVMGVVKAGHLLCEHKPSNVSKLNLPLTSHSTVPLQPK